MSGGRKGDEEVQAAKKEEEMEEGHEEDDDDAEVEGATKSEAGKGGNSGMSSQMTVNGSFDVMHGQSGPNVCMHVCT